MAFAALVSLEHTITNPTNNIQIPRDAHEALISLCSTLKKLDDKRNRRIDMSLIYALDAEIREAAYKLEDTIQYYIFHRSLPPSDSLADLQIPPVDLDDLNQEIDLFFERVNKFKEDYKRVLDNPSRVKEKHGDVSPIHDFGGNESTTVGLSDQIERVINELLDLQPGPKAVALVGMAGIGKTHVAREIARHPLIVQNFDFIAWANVGPKRPVKDILVNVVAQIEGNPRYLYKGKRLRDIAQIFHGYFRGRRYLIVLDNVWSTNVSYYLRLLLRGLEDGRRLLLTTRLEEVGKCDSNGFRQIRFLNMEESWNLLRQNVFAERYCPPQLEKVGRKIAEKCEGLPLLILRGLEQTEEFWKAVVDEKNSIFTIAYDEIYEVLFPSYEYLPQYLKACFLYMAVFPQRPDITLPKLLELWIAEDDGSNKKSYAYLKKFAMECLKKLVSHSVVIICKHSSRFRIKSCKLHPAFWHLCAKEARKIKLFHVLKKSIHASQDYIESQRRLSVQNNILFGIKEVYKAMTATLTRRSLLCTGPYHEYQVPLCLNLLLLKVLDAAAIRYYEFPIQVLKLVRLKYLALTHHGKLPSSISDLQQLQYLILGHPHIVRFVRDVDSVCLPKEMRDEIRDLPEVRSIKLLGDFTSLAKEIWEKICDIQEVWSSEVLSNPARLEKKTWMELWRITSGEDSMRRWSKMSHIQRPWSIKLLRDSNRFPREILVEIWEKIWDMQQAWSAKLLRDSIGLVKEIWEEMWEIQEVRSTKMLSNSTFLPKEIWEMRQLRHLRIIGRNLPDPNYGKRLPNLSTLFVNAHSCTYNVLNSLPGLQKLGIKIELRPDAAETISCFKHIGVLGGLQSLKCVVVNPQPAVAPADQLSNLPSSLKKLSLSGLGYGWECMSAIGSLPKLQVLKLRCAAFQGPEWETKLHEFRRLKYLLLEDIDLERWTTAENGCFPDIDLVRRTMAENGCFPDIDLVRRTMAENGCFPNIDLVRRTRAEYGCFPDIDLVRRTWAEYGGFPDIDLVRRTWAKNSCFPDIDLVRRKMAENACFPDIDLVRRTRAEYGCFPDIDLVRRILVEYGCFPDIDLVRRILAEYGCFPDIDLVQRILAENDCFPDINLVRWTMAENACFLYIDLVQRTIAENGCFPRLERLIIRHCYKLKELPLPRALKMIEVVDCSPSVVASAQQADSSVEAVITSSWKLRR